MTVDCNDYNLNPLEKAVKDLEITKTTLAQAAGSVSIFTGKDSYIELTPPASDEIITAPANGYFFWQFNNYTGYTYYFHPYIYLNETTHFTIGGLNLFSGQSSHSGLYVTKGQKIEFHFGHDGMQGGGEFKRLFFAYAKGN